MQMRAREVAVKRGRRLAARLGLDGNPLRRRTDKIAAWGVIGLLALFLVVAPIVGLAAGHWAYRAAMSQQRQQRSWRQVTAVLLQTAPVEVGSYGTGDSPALARWTPPGGAPREGVISAPAGTQAGRHVRIWVDRSGQQAETPLSPRMAAVRAAAAVVISTLMLAAALAGIASSSGWLLDRRRLAGWQAEWDSVGPQWTRQFRARG